MWCTSMYLHHATYIIHIRQYMYVPCSLLLPPVVENEMIGGAPPTRVFALGIFGMLELM